MESRLFPRFLSVLVCVLILLISVGAIFSLLGWQISELSNDLNLIKQKAIDIGERLQTFIFNHLGVPIKK